MIRKIVTNEGRLSLPSMEISDPLAIGKIIIDLVDTANEAKKHPIGCLGLAANQIGHMKRIVIIWYGNRWMPLINPEVTLIKGPKDYKQEGCLSRPGVHTKKMRYKKIRVTYQDELGAPWEERYTGFTARIIQHEVDHLNGIYI